ncbi:MAG: YeeE/YedE family protein [Chloroflexi bacterium]|nr:YeeE/YedE family protein [Chloroflexota bacterium]
MSTWTEAQAKRGLPFSGQAVRVLGGLALAALIYVGVRNQGHWQLLLVFGLLFGFILQRGRFCFASAFRDLFLLGEARVMKGILAGLAVATVGFTLVMYTFSPTIMAGRYIATANILPLGFHTLLAGVVFAIGMSLAGGCISGNLYRIGEGYVASAVALLGIFIGLLLLGYTWDFWWTASVSYSPKIWFPQSMGYVGSMLLTLLLVGISFIALLWWESRSRRHGIPIREAAAVESPGLGGQVRAMASRVFVDSWPVVTAGVLLGGLNTALFLLHHPWGVTGALYQMADAAATPLGLSPGTLTGLASLGGACNVGSERGEAFGLSHDSMIVGGMVLGSFVAASGAGEFKIRVPRQKRRLLQALIGGILMGYASALALGCTLGAFFSAVPSLALNGWLFAVGLLGGSYVGVKILRRLA